VLENSLTLFTQPDKSLFPQKQFEILVSYANVPKINNANCVSKMAFYSADVITNDKYIDKYVKNTQTQLKLNEIFQMETFFSILIFILVKAIVLVALTKSISSAVFA
jgi:hypothetical protein